MANSLIRAAARAQLVDRLLLDFGHTSAEVASIAGGACRPIVRRSHGATARRRCRLRLARHTPRPARSRLATHRPNAPRPLPPAATTHWRPRPARRPAARRAPGSAPGATAAPGSRRRSSPARSAPAPPTPAPHRPTIPRPPPPADRRHAVRSTRPSISSSTIPKRARTVSPSASACAMSARTCSVAACNAPTDASSTSPTR